MNQTTTEKHVKIQKVTLKVGGILALILITIIVIIVVRNNQIIKRENMNIDQFVAYTSSHKFSKDISGEDTFNNIDVKDNYIQVFLNKDSTTANTYLYDVIDIMEELTNDSEFINVNCKGISFNYMVNVVDKYGNVSRPVCSIVTINKQDYKKIKWETVTAKGLSLVAQKYWYDKDILNAE